MIQQLREMGGTRFFIASNDDLVPITAIGGNHLADLAVNEASDTLKEDLPFLPDFRLAFAWPDKLQVASDGLKIGDLPESWVQHILLVKPNPAPVLVIQTRLETGKWLSLAALMPNPYFLDSDNPLWLDRAVLQGLSLAAIWSKSNSATTVRACLKKRSAVCFSPMCGSNMGVAAIAPVWVWDWVFPAISCRLTAVSCCCAIILRGIDCDCHSSCALNFLPLSRKVLNPTIGRNFLIPDGCFCNSRES